MWLSHESFYFRSHLGTHSLSIATRLLRRSSLSVTSVFDGWLARTWYPMFIPPPAKAGGHTGVAAGQRPSLTRSLSMLRVRNKSLNPSQSSLLSTG